MNTAQQMGIGKAFDDLLAENKRLRAINAELVEALEEIKEETRLLAEIQADGGTAYDVARAALAQAEWRAQ